MSAAQDGHCEIIRLLLEHGANVNQKVRDDLVYVSEEEDDLAETSVFVKGWTALFFAAWAGEADAVRLLIDGGADVNIRDTAGETALSMAVKEGHKEVATMLRQHGAKE